MDAEPGDNSFTLSARIVAKEVMRYSPAGVPILTLELQHASLQTEAKSARQVEMILVAIAAGAIAEDLERTALTTLCRFTGFIAPKSRNSKQLVFHITADV